MKAIRIHAFGGPEALQFEQTPDPKAGPGQVIVRAKAVGVNPVDAYIRSGNYGERAFPFTPGIDAAGVVESIGPDVKAVKPDDRVYVYGSLSGAYAERILCKESQVHPLPEKVSFSQGAAVGVPYTTAYYGLFYRGHALSGETVLVHGASGGVGIAAVQLARSRGLTVIGTVGTPKGRDLVLKEGAHHVLYHSVATYLEELMTLTQGKGVNIVLEMAAHLNLGKVLKVLSTRGRVVVIGSRGPVNIDPRDTMIRHADIRGMSLMTVSEEEISSVQAALGAGLDNGSLRPVVGKEIPLAEAAKAHEEVMKPGAYGKIVLVP
jgi:NADPH2:quinone reductase